MKNTEREENSVPEFGKIRGRFYTAQQKRIILQYLLKICFYCLKMENQHNYSPVIFHYSARTRDELKCSNEVNSKQLYN